MKENSNIEYVLRKKVFVSFCEYCKRYDHGVFNLGVWALQRIIARFLIFGSYGKLKLDQMYTCPHWGRLLSLLSGAASCFLALWYNEDLDRPTSGFFYHNIQNSVARDCTTNKEEQGDFVGSPLVRKRRAKRNGTWTSCIFFFAPEFFEWLQTRRSYSPADLKLLIGWLSPPEPQEEESRAEQAIKDGKQAEILPLIDGPAVDPILLSSSEDTCYVNQNQTNTGSEFSDPTPSGIFVGDSSDPDGFIVEQAKSKNSLGENCLQAVDIASFEREQKSKIGPTLEPNKSNLDQQPLGQDLDRTGKTNQISSFSALLAKQEGEQKQPTQTAPSFPQDHVLSEEKGHSIKKQKNISAASAGSSGVFFGAQTKTLFLENSGVYEKLPQKPPLEGSDLLEKFGCAGLARRFRELMGGASGAGAPVLLGGLEPCYDGGKKGDTP